VTRSIPIIILTARADEKTKLTALSAARMISDQAVSTSELHCASKTWSSRTITGKNCPAEQSSSRPLTSSKENRDDAGSRGKDGFLAHEPGHIHRINNPSLRHHGL